MQQVLRGEYMSEIKVVTAATMNLYCKWGDLDFQLSCLFGGWFEQD